jgi:hypothetical protein
LLERLANTESSYSQFVSMSLAQPRAGKKCTVNLGAVNGYWPYESPETFDENGNVVHKMGDFIGLMQVKNTPDTAWNWTHNTAKGADAFKDSVRIAYKHQTRMMRRYDEPTPVPGLSGTQIEQLAVGNYKGFSAWYWVPQCSTHPFSGTCPYIPTPGTCAGGSWSWISNPCPCVGNQAVSVCEPDHPEDDIIAQVNKIIGSTAQTAPCEM